MTDSASPRQAPATYRLLEHTADMGIEAQGESLAELFAQAARGLLDILFGTPCPEGGREKLALAVEAWDREELLVAWLSELLFVVQQRDFRPSGLSVDKIGPSRLEATLTGAFAPEGSVPLREVKAITYHRLSVFETRGCWKARVFLDL